VSALIVFKRPGRVVLGADSLHQVGTNGSRSTYSAPKIRAAGRWHVACGGWVKRSGSDAVVYDVVAEAVKGESSIVDALNSLARAISPELQAALRTDGKDLWCNVFVCGVEGGRVQLGAFLADPDGNGGLRTLLGVLPGERYQHGASASGGPVLDLLRDPLPKWVRPGTVAVARRILEQQVKHAPALVGPPLDVVEITASGARWHTGGAA
jgi:hypothetical protein